ncbi:MAG: 30S ribosomal protein S2 [Candidatus Komeilibacteria bacterium]|nr:30S ribosomal protein S2 [Candidatus Komeilibacteria bacterium]
MVNLPSLLEMLKAGAHFGHQRSRWHPKMQQYIFGLRNGVHIIDLEKTLEQLATTLEYLRGMSAKGKTVLFVGTKRQAREIVKIAAENCGSPYLVERWIGGLLTNFDEFKKRLKKYKGLKEQIASGEVERYTKKEQLNIKRMVEKMDKYLVGLSSLDKIPDVLFIADLRVEKTGVAEANRLGVPIVAVCDTNVNPEKALHIIPANDDAVNSIKMIVNLVAEAVKEGKEDWEKNKLAMAEEKAKEDKKNLAAKMAAAPAAGKIVKSEKRAEKVTESL